MATAHFKETNYRAVIKYPGAKWRIADWIISKMPEHHSYVEPFFGSGAVFFRKPQSSIETVNDINGDVVHLFQTIRDHSEELIRAVSMTPYSRKEYDSAFTAYTKKGSVEQARITLITYWQSHGSRAGDYKAGWKNDVNGRERAYAVKGWNDLPEWIAAITTRLKQAQIECKDAIELVNRFNRADVLIYADPPYLLSTRKMKKQYANEMTDEDHMRLLLALREHKGPVILSGYDNALYNSNLIGWRKEQMQAYCESGGIRTETIWMNFDDNQQRLY